MLGGYYFLNKFNADNKKVMFIVKKQLKQEKDKNLFTFSFAQNFLNKFFLKGNFFIFRISR